MLWNYYQMTEPDMSIVKFVLKSNILWTEKRAEVISIMANKTIKLTSSFMQYLYFLESSPINSALVRQEERLRFVINKLRNTRNEEDMNLRKLKIERNIILRKLRIKQGEVEAYNMEIDKSLLSQTPIKGRGEIDKPRLALRRIKCSGEENESEERAERFIESPSSIFSVLIESKPDVSSRYSGVDYLSVSESRGQGQLKEKSAKRLTSPCSKKNKEQHAKLSFPTVRLPQPSQTFIENSPELRSIFDLNQQIKTKKHILYFYDLLENALKNVILSKTSRDLSAQTITKVIIDLKAALRENGISRYYLIRMLSDEIQLKNELLERLVGLEEKYKISSTLHKLISSTKKATLSKSKSLTRLSDLYVNQVAHKEFDTSLKTLGQGAGPLRESISNMLTLIREYIELKESLYGVSIGTDEMIFEHFIRQSLRSEYAADRNIVVAIENIEEEDSIKSSTESEDGNSGEGESKETEEIFRHNLGLMKKENWSECHYRDASKIQSIQGNLLNMNAIVFIKPLSEDPFATFKIRDVELWTENKRLCSVQHRQSKLHYTMEMSKTADYGFNMNLVKKHAGETEHPSLHDYVVRVFYEFKYKDMHCYLRERMEFGTLRRFLDNHIHSFTSEEVAYLIANLLLCIEKLHEHKFVNEKINLDTVLVDEEGHLKLASLGKPTLSSSKQTLYRTKD